MKRPLRLLAFAIIGTFVIALLSRCSSRQKDATHASDSRRAPTTASIPSFTTAAPVVKEQINTLLGGYFKLNQALIGDSLAGAKKASADLLAIASAFSPSRLTEEQMDFYFVQSSRLKTGLVVIRGSTDIEQARSALADVSEAMYSIVKAFRPNKAPVYYQYCPMARNDQGATWLSDTKELYNPYMGQLMLNCGRTQERLE